MSQVDIDRGDGQIVSVPTDQILTCIGISEQMTHDWVTAPPRSDCRSTSRALHSVRFGIMTDPVDLVSAAALLSSDVLAEFDQWEPPILHGDDSIIAAGRRRPQDSQVRVEWARRHDVEAKPDPS